MDQPMDVAEGEPALLVGVLSSLSFPWQLEGLRLHAYLPGVDSSAEMKSVYSTVQADWTSV